MRARIAISLFICGFLLTGCNLMGNVKELAAQTSFPIQFTPQDYDSLARYDTLRDKGWTTSRTEDGYFRLGSPDAPVVIRAFTSFSCSACQYFMDNYFHDIFDMFERGEAQYIVIPQPHYGEFDSTPMARAAFCAGEQGQFWEMQDLMFQSGADLGDSANDTTFLNDTAAMLDLDGKAFATCLESDNSQAFVDGAIQLGEDVGIRATPSIFVNGLLFYPPTGTVSPDTFRELINSQYLDRHHTKAG